MTISLRDPGGHVCHVDDRIVRVVNRAALADLRVFLNSSSSAQFLKSQRLVNTQFLDSKTTAEILQNNTVRGVCEQLPGAAIIEHERVQFPSFPYEWPAEMLYAAAELTLDFAESLVEDGLGLKDASPYNVLFRGSRPVFVDLLSFETRDAADPTWLPFAQFVRTFLLPLLVNKHFGLSLAELFTAHRDGLEPGEVFRLLRPLQKLRSPFLMLVTIPVWLSSREETDRERIYQKRRLSDPTRAKFILRGMLRNVRRKLAATAPTKGRTSVWSGYMDHNRYSEDYFPLKQAFVSNAMCEQRPARVLDVGCNTGHFSAIAARAGASVVAIDYDAVVIGEVWREANANNLDILPLVINLARPTPSIGWRNSECQSFLERARGHFDSVLMLGVIHHLLVSERIPLSEVIKLAAELTTDSLIIEFVAPDDPMFRRITRGRDHLFTNLTREFFEKTSSQHFEIVRCQQLDQTSRWLYLMKKKKESLIECFEMQQ
jgi:2-polyprenyl-3-methyl-5-hydroxy-6-metoxy-1,4-benzoquinol methylase